MNFNRYCAHRREQASKFKHSIEDVKKSIARDNFTELYAENTTKTAQYLNPDRDLIAESKKHQKSLTGKEWGLMIFGYETDSRCSYLHGTLITNRWVYLIKIGPDFRSPHTQWWTKERSSQRAFSSLEDLIKHLGLIATNYRAISELEPRTTEQFLAKIDQARGDENFHEAKYLAHGLMRVDVNLGAFMLESLEQDERDCEDDYLGDDSEGNGVWRVRTRDGIRPVTSYSSDDDYW